MVFGTDMANLDMDTILLSNLTKIPCILEWIEQLVSSCYLISLMKIILIYFAEADIVSQNTKNTFKGSSKI